MTGASRAPRMLVAAVVTMLVVSAAPMLSNARAGAQQDQVLAASGYTPCEPGQKDIDLLVMMDASGSLNSPGSGKDRDGNLRRTALQRFREDLANLLGRLPEEDAGRVRISLWRFDREVKQIAGFEEASSIYPSDEHIEESLGEPNPWGDSKYRFEGKDTDYLKALSEARQAFLETDNPGECRILLFFTDGLYDPTGNPTLGQADDLRREVCGEVKESYERAGINTFSILVGQAFRAVADGSVLSDEQEAIQAEMAEASKQALRALTGDADSPLVRGLPYLLGFNCERWSDDQPEDRDGSIIAVDDLASLAIQLLEVAETAARQLEEWTNCGIEPGLNGRSGPLPAGRYFETIVAYPRGSRIESYEIVTVDGESRSKAGSDDRPLYIDNEDLNDLEAGWTLKITTNGGSGDSYGTGGIEVACYFRTVASGADESDGSLLDREGQPLPEIYRSPEGPDSPPLDGIRIQAESVTLLGLCDHQNKDWLDPRVRDWYCRDGMVIVELQPLECGETHEFSRPLEFEFVPQHSEDLFGPAGVKQTARIEVSEPKQLHYDCLGAPRLTCDDDVNPMATDGTTELQAYANEATSEAAVRRSRLTVEPDNYELPREQLRGILSCNLYPPPDTGSVSLNAHWRPDNIEDLPGELDWRFDDDHHYDEQTGELDETGKELTLKAYSSNKPVQLHFVTVDELVNADWQIAGIVELGLSWDTGVTDVKFNEDAREQMERQRVDLRIDAEYAARSDSGLARWLTLLLLLASLLLSYLLFCLALSSTFSLPDPGRFWWRHVVLRVERSGRSGYSFLDDPLNALNSAPGESITGDRVGRSRSRPRYRSWRGPTPQPGADNIGVNLKRSFRFWLIGLLRGPWSEVRSTQGRAVAVSPAVPKRSRSSTQVASRAQFNRLMVVGSPRQEGANELAAPVWVALPKSGWSSLLEPADTRELSRLLNETASNADHDSSGEIRVNPGDSEAGRNGTGSTAGETLADTSGRPPPRRLKSE